MSDPSERERMIAGQPYRPADPELSRARRRARDLLRSFNEAAEGERSSLYRELFAAVGHEVWIEPPFCCDYGGNIRLGDRVYLNFNCVILDPAPVTLGSDVFFGPGVQVYTATHPLDPIERRSGVESARAITIGSDVWVGGGSIILPGVTIGERTVIGAGSVVTRDIPAGVVAVGNPCRVLRQL